MKEELYREKELTLPTEPTGQVAYLGGHLEERREVYEAASSLNHVTEDDPPLLLVHGELDEITFIEQFQIIHEAYQKAGLEAAFTRISAASHGLASFYESSPDSPISPSGEEIEQIVLDFFIKHLLRSR